MSESKRLRARWRALITETLPYEVPVIFSNDRLYASLVATNVNPLTAAQLERVRSAVDPGTKPYTYKIRKDRGNSTSIGIIHPLWQMKMAEFYDSYARTILDYCSVSEFSLRRPVGITPTFSQSELDGDSSFRIGIPHIDPAEGEMDVSHITSFFSYSRYNLLGKFIDSDEFLQLEKRFSRLRTLDISKCFFNIYTHSITWAIKEKAFSKRFRNSYSFEAKFDELMQRANYNETNGIVIGPEASRIFAEIILQRIDLRVQHKLKWLQPDVDYAIRRYLDDYYIFCNDEAIADDAQRTLEAALEEYKLFFNENKTETQARPFVSNISLARRDIVESLATLQREFSGLSAINDPAELKRKGREVRRKLREIRFIVADHAVGFHTISGWLLTALRSVVGRTVFYSNSGISNEQLETLTEIAVNVLELVFYVTALDVRVRTTYSVCQIVSIVSEFASASQLDFRDRVLHVIAKELEELLGTTVRRLRNSEITESVEAYNLLITGALFLGSEFLQKVASREALEWITAGTRISYFGFVTAKFCFLRDPSRFADRLREINDRVKGQIVSNAHMVKWDSELFLLLADFLSSHDVNRLDRRAVYTAVFPTSGLSNAALDEVCRHLGFVDWTGLRVKHFLERKELRPVYAVW